MRSVAVVLWALLLVACATPHPAPPQSTTAAEVTEVTEATFVVVRHGEKADDGTPDPPLAPAGVERARSLARHLADAPLVAVYATPFRRTQLTAQPAAGLHGLRITLYDPAKPASDLAASLRTWHHDGTILIVGHSNTVPAIAAALCRCTVAPLGERDYGAVYIVRMRADGTGALQVDRQSWR